MKLTTPQTKVMEHLIDGKSLFITGFQQTGKTTILKLYKEWITLNKPEYTALFLEEFNLNKCKKDRKYIILVDDIVKLKEMIIHDPITQEPLDTKVQKKVRSDFWMIPEIKRRVNVSQIVLAGYYFDNLFKYYPNIDLIWFRRPMVRDNDMIYDLPETNRLRTSETPSD